MEIDKVQLYILSILTDAKATAPGVGMTLREIAEVVNESIEHRYSFVTISRKVWALRDSGYVASKIKSNKADMFYITEKGIEMKGVLLGE